ncbi:hypothetical protein F6R98_06320 [Candidatus Methylospira mobilis]|uniref:Uncharacterized protein n=1 Tax=Candidatus Methylospira mobilis TaxID=1808979 RepID=A0A5Q0BJE5_9GAMM|nr:hypothetical protein [Candidatus Methylospira mobilis]QFY42287.1 hypothetical protein F6R98_06320 [Candidatus Methylospira mobilis]WNV04010.1 hypothetical protein RP726_16515 [Candidatus Methylospira mobilis]
MPKISPKLSAVLLILFIVALYWIQDRAVIPFVMKIIQSELFFEKDEEQEEIGKINNERADFALTHCKTAVKQDKDLPETAQFDDKNFEAWALGGKVYLVRSSILVPSDNNASKDEKKYACKIKWKGEEMSKFESWSVMGLDFQDM